MIPLIQSQNVPNEIAFITLLESRYFSQPGYPVEISSSKAVGPWQFLASTAGDFGLRIFPLSGSANTLQADKCDERAILEPSTLAAAKYFKLLFNLFPDDPKLAILSYNWGQGNVAKVLGCLGSEQCMKNHSTQDESIARIAKIKEMGLSYWTIREFNVAPAGALQYVVNFVAAQFVGREPNRYGISSIDLVNNKTTPAPVSKCK